MAKVATVNLLLALIPSASLVNGRRGDLDSLELDNDDVAPPCRDICAPIVRLTDQCDVDLPSDNDRDEHLLERQCVCTNTSFDVERIAGLCADCSRQNMNYRDDDSDDDDDDDDDDSDDGDEYRGDDIRKIMSACGFSSASYASSDSTAAQSVTVAVTTPTDVSQLTTTIGAGGAAASDATKTSDTAASGATNTDGGSDGDSDSDGSSGGSGTESGTGSSPSDTGLAAPGAVPLWGFSAPMALGIFGGLAAGLVFMM